MNIFFLSLVIMFTRGKCYLSSYIKVQELKFNKLSEIAWLPHESNTYSTRSNTWRDTSRHFIRNERQGSSEWKSIFALLLLKRRMRTRKIGENSFIYHILITFCIMTWGNLISQIDTPTRSFSFMSFTNLIYTQWKMRKRLN